MDSYCAPSTAKRKIPFPLVVCGVKLVIIFNVLPTIGVVNVF